MIRNCPPPHKELMEQVQEMEGLLEGLKSMLASLETKGGRQRVSSPSR